MSDVTTTPSGSPADTGDQPYQVMMQAVMYLGAGQYGLAAELYRQAAALFDTLARTGEADSREAADRDRAYCQAQSETTDGLDFARLGDRSKALVSLTGAINRFNRIAALDLDRGIRDQGVIVSLNGAKTTKYNLEMMADIADDDFDAALATAQRVRRDLANSRSQIADAGLSAEMREQMYDIMRTVELAMDGLENYATAERASLELKWEKALAAFLDAKQSLRDARDTCAAIPMLAVQAQSYQMLVEMLVDPARRRCVRLRKVYDDFEQFKTTLAKATGVSTVNVSQTQELTSTLTSKIDIRTTIVNEFRDRTHSALDGLRKAMIDAPIDDEKRRAAIKDLDEVFAPHADPDGFLDRLKGFCGKSAGIVGDIAKVARPVATAWNVFAPLLGWPALPVPAA